MSTINEPSIKKLDADPVIGTHNGMFHCDDALACTMLKLLPEYQRAEIIRTRDTKLLDTCDIVVDVGGVYDPKSHRYDHHQRSFAETFNSLDSSKKWATKLSSAGLVYFHFGKRIIGEVVKEDANADVVHCLYDKVYEKLIEEVDAIDNGVSICDGVQRYEISTHLSSRVRNLNPSWNEEDKDYDAKFENAMDLVRIEFLDRINYYYKSWWPARSLVKQAVDKRHEVDPSGEILELGCGSYPWKEHLYSIEEEFKISPLVKFVIFADANNNWRVQGASVSSGSFKLRIPLPEEWQGLRDDDLSDKSGIPGCIFCHATGFIGGNKSRDGALEMARKAIASNS